MIDYVNIFFRSVNHRFASLLPKLKIRFRLASLLSIGEREAQPWIENNYLVTPKGLNSEKIIKEFKQWAYTYRKKNKPVTHDLIVLLMGGDISLLIPKDEEGKDWRPISGRGGLKGVSIF